MDRKTGIRVLAAVWLVGSASAARADDPWWLGGICAPYTSGTWSPVTANTGEISLPVRGLNEHVWAMVMGSGPKLEPGLYACGNFTVADFGTTVSYIARWNGSDWKKLGDGLDRDCLALAIGPDGNLYAGMAFAEAVPGAGTQLAMWDGSGWSSIPVDMMGFGNPYALEFHDDDGNGTESLFIGGSYLEFCDGSGCVDANGMAEATGEDWGSWSQVKELGGSPGVGDQVWVRTFMQHQGVLWLAGQFTIAGDVPAQKVATWDGLEYAAVGGDIAGDVTGVVLDLELFDGEVCAGGMVGPAGTNLFRLDGGDWKVLGGGVDDLVEGLMTADLGNGKHLFAAGFFTVANPSGANPYSANYIAAWDGNKWRRLGAGLGPVDGEEDLPETHGMVMLQADDANGPGFYLGGKFSKAGKVQANNIARYSCPYLEAKVGGTMDVKIPLAGSGDVLEITDEGDGLPELASCGGRDFALGAGATVDLCGVRVVVGTSGDDSLSTATATTPTVIYGGAGNDVITGSRYADRVIGGPGNDSISAGDGDDVLVGGEGDDSCVGGSGRDALAGGPGRDSFDGAEGDVVYDD